MIQPLSSNVSVLQSTQLQHSGTAEGPGETENEGDRDDAGAAVNAANAAQVNTFPDFMGTMVNTLA